MKTKRLIIVVLCLIFAVVLGACGSDSDTENQENNTQQTQNEGSTQKKYSINIDMTKLSTTMADAELTRMSYDPQNYKGNVIKIKGTYNLRTNPAGGDYLNYCVFNSSCCGNGLEFVLEDGAEYPKTNTQITVIGTFTTYTVEDTVYGKLVNAVIV